MSAYRRILAARKRSTSASCPRASARPAGQFVGTIADAGGLMRYLALHFQKQSQEPPRGWRGQRFTHSRGYLTRPTPEARQAARESLRHRREVWKRTRLGQSAQDAENGARQAMAIAAATDWELVLVDPITGAPRGAQDRAPVGR